MSESSYIDLLDRICVNGVCHCDWRLTLRDCVEAKAMTIVYGINIGLSALSIIVGKIRSLLNCYPQQATHHPFFSLRQYRYFTFDSSCSYKGP